MKFQLLFPHVLLAILQITITLALGLPRDRVHCSTDVTHSVDSGDCVVLLAMLQSKPWFSKMVKYGDREAPPGRTPILETYGTCVFKLFFRGQMHTGESIRMAKYLPLFDRVINECTGPASLYRGGHVYLGHSPFFFAYIGGDAAAPGVRVNGTLVRDLVGI